MGAWIEIKLFHLIINWMVVAPFMGAWIEILKVTAFVIKLGRSNLILHSDQGWNYQHKQYQKMLKEKDIR